ncbi:hypothetical protein CC1G_02723 [Coprinopsis cinerea okayama7|uniref:Uncharacterized protein n=1 Tax=Coprinopsis cinerea (strain Okayama-7 / 130 / ATCC MYA-4618 / FGSC 9003) TaxID=240176 RepID=A8PBS6_COPC7|nr:hypothetical protein CC1G_02723 [Coprinopsis cinerea okayama7\|eukprot:XP_001840260.2 hypothetical protein CC1G_02723 [Coprinopsis cinerea okayama7\
MPNPSRRHGTRSNPTKSSSLPPEELEPRLLNLDLQLPSLPSIVAGLTDTLGLTGGQQPAPAPAPSPQQPPAQPAPQPSPQQPAPQPAPSQQPAPSPQPAPPPASSTHAGSAPSNPTSSIPPNVSSSPSSSPSSGVSSNVPSASQVPGAEVTGRPPNLNLGSSGDLPDLSDHLAPAPIANAGERPDERVSASTTSLESTRTRTFVTNGSTSIVVVGPSDKPIPTDPRGSPSPNDNSSAGSSKSNHVVIAVVAPKGYHELMDIPLPRRPCPEQ